jgi:hypothetical protein
VGGISANVGQARQSLEQIRAFAAVQPTVYLPSHDPQSVTQLSARQVTRL